MAATIVLSDGGSRSKQFTVTFPLDADITAVVPHGFNGIPDMVIMLPLSAQVYTGQVFRSAVDATNVTFTKNAAVGSGGAQIQVTVFFPNSVL